MNELPQFSLACSKLAGIEYRDVQFLSAVIFARIVPTNEKYRDL